MFTQIDLVTWCSKSHIALVMSNKVLTLIVVLVLLNVTPIRGYQQHSAKNPSSLLGT